MLDPEFIKVNLNKKLNIIEASPKSLHHKRSIIITDHVNEAIWIVQGSNVNKKLIAISQKVAIEIASKKNYKIIDNYSTEAKDLVKKIVAKEKINIKDKSNKSGIKKTKKPKNKKLPKTIPKTPVVPKVDREDHVLAGDINHDGPKIEAFQIEYFEDEPLEFINYLEYGINMMRKLELYSKGKISKMEFKKEISLIIDTIPSD